MCDGSSSAPLPSFEHWNEQNMKKWVLDCVFRSFGHREDGKMKAKLSSEKTPWSRTVNAFALFIINQFIRRCLMAFEKCTMCVCAVWTVLRRLTIAHSTEFLHIMMICIMDAIVGPCRFKLLRYIAHISPTVRVCRNIPYNCHRTMSQWSACNWPKSAIIFGFMVAVLIPSKTFIKLCWTVNSDRFDAH